MCQSRHSRTAMTDIVYLLLMHLMGLILKLISDITYVLVDPRIDFESREGA